MENVNRLPPKRTNDLNRVSRGYRVYPAKARSLSMYSAVYDSAVRLGWGDPVDAYYDDTSKPNEVYFAILFNK